VIFTVGNLLTLGIVVLCLILYRYVDKNNRSLDKVRKYAEKCKEDIAAYTQEKAAAVRNFGIDLDVERKAAAELMRHIQELTEQELAQKAQAIARIDERIKAYDSSLEELVKMTGRVQENMNRIRDESAFVENTGKRISEAKEKLEHFEKSLAAAEKTLGETGARIEQENAAALEKAAQEVVAEARSKVADFEANAETIGRKVEDARAEVDKIEQQRQASLRRDLEIVNKTLKEAVERAGSRADKMEEAALVKLRDQAQERINQLKSVLEDKIKTTQEGVKLKLAEIQEQLKTSREEWKTESAAIEGKQKTFRDEWKKNTLELNTLAKQQHDEFNAAFTKQRETWSLLAKDSERTIIAAAEARLEEYKKAQAETYKQLSGAADDAARLEAELRVSMGETVTKVNGDFARFTQESRAAQEAAAAEFTAQVRSFRVEMENMDKELAGLKQRAFDNVSEKLKVFEDDFLTDLGKRSAEIDRRLAEWQQGLDSRIDSIAEENAGQRRETEARLAEELRANLAGQGERITAELDRLKQETGAFEEGIREEMRAADETRLSFNQQIRQDMEEIRAAAETEIKTQIGQHSLALSETLRQDKRELEEKLKELSGRTSARYAELESAADNSRRGIEDWQNQYNAQMRDMDASMEELRRRSRDMAAENDERAVQAKTAMDGLRAEIDDQAKHFESANELKAELERRMEEINADLDRLDQRKNEIAQMEGQLTRIKRLEDDVNAKMTRFLSEKHRIELMEDDFNRLLQTSQAVEEKLAQVSSSDDTLQAVQVQIRRLEDAIKETEEKYQRVERKGQILEETNNGIDRNFKALQESEAALKKAGEEIAQLAALSESIRSAIETLALENEKAKEAAEKLDTLDDSLTLIEKRIAEMEVAREWLARTETELAALDKDAQTQLRLTRSLLDREGGKITAAAGKKGKGAPPPQDRDNVIRLKRQGWTVEEIANTLHLSKGEVELILELGSRD
jgi:chromosome segregation ATPase